MSENIKLLLCSKKVKGANNVKFKTFFTFVKILVKGEEEKGLQEKSLTIKFDEKVDTKDFVRGIIEVPSDKISIPYKYSVTKDDKGKDRYPVIFINQVVNYESRTGTTTAVFDLKDESEELEETEIK